MRSAAEILQLLIAGVVPNLAYLAVGAWALRLLRPEALEGRGAERLALAYVLGTGVCSLAILALRAAGIPLPLPVLALLAVLVVPGLRRSGSVPPRASGAAPGAGVPGWVRAVDTATLAVAVFTFVAALGPETYWDGFEYHLPLARAWAEGPIRALPGMLDAEFRAGVDLLYVPAAAAGELDAAAAVSACFAVALAALIRAEACRRASPGAGSLAGLFTLVVPFALDNATSSYVDLGVAAYGFVALLAADRWNRGGNGRSLVVSALCLGFVVNAKLHAAALCPAVLLLVLLGGRRPSPRQLARASGIVALLVAPWFVKVSLTTGNPLFPLFGDWLGYGPTTEQHLSLRRLRIDANYPPGTRSLWGFVGYLASVTFGRNPHVSLLGPLPLALVPLAFRRPTRATAALSGVLAGLFVLQVLFMPALRFAAPLLPFLAVAAAVGGARLARSGRLARGVLGALLALLAVHHGAALASRYAPRLLALVDPAAYERERFPEQVALRDVVAGAPSVVAIPMGASSWMPKPVYLLLWERNGELFFDGRTPPASARALLEARGVRSLVLDVPSPLPGDGSVGHRIVDAWLREGSARLHPDPDPPSARGDRIWVRVDLSR